MRREIDFCINPTMYEDLKSFTNVLTHMEAKACIQMSKKKELDVLCGVFMSRISIALD